MKFWKFAALLCLVGLELQVELARTTDPLEREALLLRITKECEGTEEGAAAWWSLSDLYLDAFDEPREDKARAALEKITDSRWGLQARARLEALKGK